jgi:uncharacterized membrane protein
MIDSLRFVLTLLSALGCGLMAGVFFAFSAFVMNALARPPPAEGIAAMQSINIAVINPWFFAAFFGTAAACIALAVISVLSWREPGSGWLVMASALYLAGTFLVTIVFNVPLNDALAAVDAKSAEAASLWSLYLPRWTAWNHVRTGAALAALASLFMALR